jgi:Tol biopolymer transport system component
VTSDRNDEFSPVFLPGGDRLLFVSDRGGSGFYDLYEASVSGGPVKAVYSTKQDKTQPTLSRDGRFLLFITDENARHNRQLLPLDGSGEVRRLSSSTRFEENSAEISPDGQSNVFVSDESGSRQVYVESLAGGPKRQVSVTGGGTPTWRADVKEIFFLSLDGNLMAAPVRKDGTGRLEVGDPQPLFPLNLGAEGIEHGFRRPYDAAPDGEKFLVIRKTADAEPAHAVVVLNWTRVLAPKANP